MMMGTNGKRLMGGWGGKLYDAIKKCYGRKFEDHPYH